MPTDNLTITHRLTTLKQRVTSETARSLSLTREASEAVQKSRWPGHKTRGLFVKHLLSDAQDKLVEIRMNTRDFAPDADLSDDCVAICEVWALYVCDMHNRAVRVLDDREDIWGKLLPTGGLHDK